MKFLTNLVFPIGAVAIGLLTAQCSASDSTDRDAALSQPMAEEQSVKNVEAVSPADFANRLIGAAASGVQLLDVRSPREQNQGIIRGATLVDFSKRDVFLNRIDQLDKNRPVMVYCAVGGRSSAAARMLAERGFRQIIDLQGGIDAWRRSGQEIVDPNGN